MRHTFSALLFLTLFVVSCQKSNHNFGIPDGTYVGTFERTTTGEAQLSNVTITFSKNNWTGQSEFAKYPALCRGSYKTNGLNAITFANDCAWTAEFDWSLILLQDYTFKLTGDSLEISRDYNGAFKDIYKLKKQ